MEGIYRNGKLELLQPLEEAEGSRVIVTLVREDWDRPEMAANDDLPPRDETCQQ